MSNIKSFKKPPRWRLYFSMVRGLFFIFEKSYSLKSPRWKDKWETPRCEQVPYIRIMFLWFDFYFFKGSEEEWEKYLWIHVYHDGNEDKARGEWGWIDPDTKESTWFNVK